MLDVGVRIGNDYYGKPIHVGDKCEFVLGCRSGVHKGIIEYDLEGFVFVLNSEEFGVVNIEQVHKFFKLEGNNE